jgi:hypothetical protein
VLSLAYDALRDSFGAFILKHDDFVFPEIWIDDFWFFI